MTAAVIGLGPQGKRVASVLEDMPGVTLTAVVDVREEALSSVALPEHVRRLGSTSALAPGEFPDLVCVTTNGPSHAALALQAMEAGARFVMVEKPMACSLDECDRMIAEADLRGVRLAVNQSRRMDPAYRWLRDRIRSREWGKVRLVSIQRPRIGLGCLGTHSFDLVRFLLDRDVISVTAWVDAPLGPNPRGDDYVDPGGLVILELPGGARGVIAQIEDGAGPTSVEIDCTGARIRIDEWSGCIEVVRTRSAQGSGRAPAYESVDPPPGLSARIDLMQMIRGLLDELLAAGRMECQAIHGRAAMEILVAAHKSAGRANVPVSLPLVAETDRTCWLPVT